MSEANKAIVERWTEIWNTNDMSAVDQVVTQDLVVHLFEKDLRGHEGLKQAVGAQFDAFPDGHFTVHEMIAEGDKVVGRWTFEGTHKGTFLGVAATGKRVAFPGLTMLRVAGGKIAEHWGYSEVAGFFRQVGKPLL